MNQGFHHRLSGSTYHADPAPSPSLSHSVAEILLRESPMKAWYSHPRLNPNFQQDEDGKFDIGTAAHALLLEGLDNIVVCDFADWKKNEAKAQRDAARSRGKTPLLTHQAVGVRAMVKTALDFIGVSRIRNAWQDSDAELTGVWEEDGIWLRMRADIFAVDRTAIIDYKSTTDVSPDAFARQIVRMGYHRQDAFYRRGGQAIAGTDPRFVFLAQSVEPPYECTLHECHPSLKEIADLEVESIVERWRVCVESNDWPSYENRINAVMPPTYLIAAHEERLLEGANVGWRE